MKSEAMATNISKETFEEFSARVKLCMLNFPTTVIDNIIESMPKRIQLIVENKGMRMKY